MHIEFIKNLEKHFPKEALDVLVEFSVLNVEKYPADDYSQEFLYLGMMKLSREITLKLAAKG